MFFSLCVASGGESIDWTFELGLCERCADKNTSNYHAWSHRQWVLQKAPFLLNYEIRFTEKFIRKHISDYSGYNHRQHILVKMLETGYHDDDAKDDYRPLREFVQSFVAMESAVGAAAAAELRQLFVHAGTDDCRAKTMLYCLNVAASDLRMCAELTNMYGYREAFQCHRKAMLKFIVDSLVTNANGCGADQELDENVNGDDDDATPHAKIIKYSSVINRLPELLTAIKRAEGDLGESHRQWCNIFLGFDYSDYNNDD